MEHREHQAEPNGKSRLSLSEVRGRSSFGCIKRSVASMSIMQAVSADRQGGFVVLLLYGGIAFLFFGSVHSWSRYYFGTGPDPLTYIWGLNWWPWAIQHGLNPLVTRFAWYPTGFHTAWADLVPGGALLGLPLMVLADAVVAYNALMVLAPALAAWCCFLLLSHLTKDTLASVLCGYLFGFSSYELGHMLGHLSLVLVFPIPLVLWIAILRISAVIARARFILLLTAILLLQFAFSLEVLATMYVAGGTAWLATMLFLPGHRKRLWILAGDVSIATAILALVTTPWLVYMYDGRNDTPEIINIPAEHSADLMNFIVPTRLFQFGGATFKFVSSKFHGNIAENGSYLGLPLIGILVAWFRKPGPHGAVSRILLVTMILLILLSLGPIIRVWGNLLDAWAPWQLLLQLPLIRHALPCRLSVYIALLTAIAAGLWLASAQNRTSKVQRYGLCLLAIALLFPDLKRFKWSPIPFTPFFERENLERFLGTTPNVTVLPFVPIPHKDYGTMIWQFQSGMAYTQTGGYLGNPPPKSYKWAATSQLVQGVAGPQFAKDIELYAAAHNITAVVAGPGTQPSLLHSLDELGWDNESLAGVHVYHVPRAILP